MDGTTAQAPHVQPAGERIRGLLMTLLVGLIFKDHNDVQGKIPVTAEVAVSTIRGVSRRNCLASPALKGITTCEVVILI